MVIRATEGRDVEGTRTNPWFHSAWMKGPSRTMANMSCSWISLKNLTMSYCPSKLNCKGIKERRCVCINRLMDGSGVSITMS